MNEIIKISINFIISVIIFFIFSLFGIYLLLAISGINLQNINLQNIHIKQLYIKIDKKLIIEADNIKILSNNKEKTNYTKINKMIKNNLIYLNYFQKISAHNIQINDMKINYLRFFKNKLKLDTNLVYLNSSFSPQKKSIAFTIHKVIYKPKNIILTNIQGYETANIFKLNLFAKYQYKNSIVNLNLNTGIHTKYKVTIENLNDTFINKFTPILKDNNISLTSKELTLFGNEKNINTIINNSNLKYSTYKISSNIPNLKAKYNINNGKFKITFKNTSLNKDKNNVNSKTITLNGDKNILNFNIKNLSLNSNDYNLSTTIPNLDGKYNIKNSQFNLNLNNIVLSQNKNILNSKIITLNGNKNIVNFNLKNSTLKYDDYNLSATIPNLDGNYDIKNKKLKTKLEKIVLTQSDIKKPNNITLNNLSLSFKDNKLFVTFYTNETLNKNLISLLKKFNISLSIYQEYGKNSEGIYITYNLKTRKIDTLLKAKIKDSKLVITPTNYLDIKKANLELNNSIITLKDTQLNYKKSIADLNYHIKNGIIDLNKSFIETNGTITSLKLQNIGTVTDFNETLYIDLKNLDFYLRNLKADILIKDKTTIDINKLSILYPYIKYLQDYNISEGNIKIDIGDKLTIKTNITKTKQQILEQNLKPLKKLNLTTTIDGDKIQIKNHNLRIDILNKKTMKIDGGLKNLDLNITKFINDALKEKNKTKQTNSVKVEKNKSKPQYIVDIKGLNNNIIYEKHQLYSHKLSIHYDNNFTKIESLDNDRNITLLQKNNALKIYGLNIREKDLKNLANISFIKNPKLNFFALETNKSSAIYGFIQINRGYIKELKALNNIIAFINLIPSIVTFSGPGFSNKGFKIRDAHIDYIYDKGILYIKKGYVKGDNLKFKFQGYVDTVKKTIKMGVDVTIVVKLIKDIPIVNYIILGKDGGITLKLLVSGKLNNPKVEKNIAKEVISAPFGIIKRTLLTPFRIFMDE